MNRTSLAACLLLAVGLVPSGPAAAVSGDHAKKPTVTVFGPDGSDQLTTFTTAKCGKRRGGTFLARSVSPDGAWRMVVAVPHFKGFSKDYDIPFGTLDPDKPSVSISPTHGVDPTYASWHHPAYDVPGYGQVNFDNRGKHMGVGFGPAMFDDAGESAVTFAGAVTCRYKKKHR